MHSNWLVKAMGPELAHLQSRRMRRGSEVTWTLKFYRWGLVALGPARGPIGGQSEGRQRG